MEYVSKIDRSYLLWCSSTALRMVLFNGPGVMYIHIYILSALYTCQEFLEAIQLRGIIMLLHSMLCDIIIYKHCCDHLHENHSATLVGHLGRG